MGQSFGSNVQWTTDDIPKLVFYTNKASVGSSSHSIFRGTRSGLSDSRHPSPSLAYDYAHEGLWDKLVARCREYPSDCMYIDRFYNTPLHLACRRNPPLFVVHALIQANSGALRIRTVDGLTPLHFACYCGSEYSIIQALLQAYPEAAGLCDQRGRTPLHFATAGLRTSDRAKVIQCLLDVKSDVVNWEDDRSRTPLTLLFEDYAEEIEGDELQEVLSRMVTLRKKIKCAPQDSTGLDRLDADTGEDGYALGSIASHSGIDWDEVSECWESIMFLIKASYFHLYRDSLLLSTLLESEADNATFNSAQSSNSMEGTARSNNMGCWKPTDEDYSSEAKWNILHASVGVPHCPAKFVQIVINLYPEFASQKDINGNLPLHIAAKRTEFRAGEAEGSFPAPLVPIHTRQLVQKAANKINIMNGSGNKHGSLGLYKTQSHGSIAFCLDIRNVSEEERYKQSASIIIQDLVRIYPNALKEEDAQGKTPLLLAIEHGKPWDSGLQELLESYADGFDEEKVKASLLVGLTAEVKSLSKTKTSHNFMQEEDPNKESNYIFKQITCNTVQIETVKTLQKLLPLFTKVAALADLFLLQCQRLTYSETINPIHDVATKYAMLQALALVLRHMKDGVSCEANLLSQMKGSACDESFDGNNTEIMTRALSISKPLLYGTQRCIREGAARVLGAACNSLGPDSTTEVLRDVILVGDVASTDDKRHATEVDLLSTPTMVNNSTIDENLGHGKAWGIYSIFSLPVGKLVESKTKYFVDDKHQEAISVLGLTKDLLQHKSIMVREGAGRTIGVLIASSSDPKSYLKEVKSSILKIMRLAESTEVLTSLASGLIIAARECKGLFRSKQGISLLDGALMLAMSGPAAVKVSYNDFLWLALDIGEGNEGLHEYMNQSQGDNGKIMMTLVTKVLGQMDGVSDRAS